MKKNFFIFFSLLCIVQISAQQPTTAVSDIWTFAENNGYLIKKVDNKYEFNRYDGQYFLTNEDIFINTEGWKKLKKEFIPCGYFDRVEKKVTKFDAPYIIDGSNYLIFFDSFTNGATGNYMTKFDLCIGSIDTFSNDILNEHEDYTAPIGWNFDVIKFNIQKINASSYYVENTKSGFVYYKADLLHILIKSNGPIAEWIRHVPWVPAKKNNASGIDEFLTIEFTEPQDNIVVLNGYVDPFRRYLYKANNRVKTARIKSLDVSNPFEIEYEFADYVHFAEIDFPLKVNKVQFIIKDVYKGEKWNDTCVSAVITRYDK